MRCGLRWIVVGWLALSAYGCVATLQPPNDFGRTLAACCGAFVTASLAWVPAVRTYRARCGAAGAGTAEAGAAS